jgi:hypothetical protein
MWQELRVLEGLDLMGLERWSYFFEPARSCDLHRQ